MRFLTIKNTSAHTWQQRSRRRHFPVCTVGRWEQRYDWWANLLLSGPGLVPVFTEL